MHRQPAAVVLVFRYDMDKTLKDYIERAQKKIKEDNSLPLDTNPNQYPVKPENKENEDRNQNPYGQH